MCARFFARSSTANGCAGIKFSARHRGAFISSSDPLEQLAPPACVRCCILRILLFEKRTMRVSQPCEHGAGDTKIVLMTFATAPIAPRVRIGLFHLHHGLAPFHVRVAAASSGYSGERRDRQSIVGAYITTGIRRVLRAGVVDHAGRRAAVGQAPGTAVDVCLRLNMD
jgi:hypothetical protein